MKKRTIIWLSALLALLLGIVSMASIADSALDIALNASGGSLSFINDGAYPWQVVSIDGRTAAMSGNRGCHSTDSSVSLTAYVGEGQSLEFDWNVDSEAYTTLIPRDYLGFAVDGEYMDFIHSTEENTPLGWQHYVWTAEEAGTYTFEWIYVKDSTVSAGEDCGYLDNVEITGEEILPPTPTPPPQPGESFTIYCEDFSAQPDDWWNDDFDGDGNYWEWGTAYGHDAPGAIYSYSYLDWGGALTPDNQACTPEFTIPEGVSEATLSFWLYSMDDEYCFEHIDVLLVSIEENFYGGYDLYELAELGSITLSDGEWHEYSFDLTQFAGYEDVNIAFVHRDVTDQYGIVLDDVIISATMGGGAEEPIIGDVNGDGLITSSDAVLIIRHGMGLVSLSEELLPLADVNSDGTVNTADAVTVMRMSMGL